MNGRLARTVLTSLACLTLAATGIVGTASAAGADRSTPSRQPAAKVKCVNKVTGFARYSSSGSCTKKERVDRKACRKGGTCVVGDIGPGGGRVFYSARAKQSWGRYLEAAPAAWTSGGDPNLTWCSNVTDSIPGTQATGLGAGRANTTAMLGVCTTDAAVAASSYRGGGKSDWYLPSRDELRQLFLRKAKVGTAGFQLHGYWSSSEVSANEGWIQDFYADYTPAPSDKGYANYVRPIRAF